MDIRVCVVREIDHISNSVSDRVPFAEYITTGGPATNMKVPVVNMNSPEWDILEAEFLGSPSGVLNLTVDNEGYGMWVAQKESGIFIFFSATAIPFALINIVLASVALSQLPFRPSTGVLCLLLEILANAIRMLYAFDPAAPWPLWPYPIEATLLSINIPISLSSMVLLTLHWQDLVDFSSLNVSSALSRTKIPAVVITVTMVIVEACAAAVRAADINFQGLAAATGIIYVCLGIMYIIHTSYVAIKVLAFFRKFGKLNQTQKTLRRFSIRTLASVIGMVLSTAAGVCSIFLGSNTAASFFSIYGAHIGLNFLGLLQIMAFLHGSPFGRNNSASSGRADSTQSSIAMSQRSLSLTSDYG